MAGILPRFPRPKANAVRPERRSRDKVYKDGQREQLGITEREIEDKHSWRRITFILSACFVFSLFGNIVALAKDHTEVQIYRENAAGGDLVYLGPAQRAIAPDDAAVRDKIRRWIELRGMVHEPTDRGRLDTEQTELFALTQARSPAYLSLTAERQGANSPDKLGASIRRSDRVIYISHIAGSKLSYEADFDETTTPVVASSVGGPDQRQTVRHYHVTLTIAPPRLAASQALALYNGAGMYVVEYDVKEKV